jgi:hypothetical protein
MFVILFCRENHETNSGSGQKTKAKHALIERFCSGVILMACHGLEQTIMSILKSYCITFRKGVVCDAVNMKTVLIFRGFENVDPCT